MTIIWWVCVIIVQKEIGTTTVFATLHLGVVWNLSHNEINLTSFIKFYLYVLLRVHCNSMSSIFLNAVYFLWLTHNTDCCHWTSQLWRNDNTMPVSPCSVECQWFNNWQVKVKLLVFTHLFWSISNCNWMRQSMKLFNDLTLDFHWIDDFHNKTSIASTLHLTCFFSYFPRDRILTEDYCKMFFF